MELHDYILFVQAKQSDAQRAFRRAELAGLTTLQSEPRRQWFARLGTRAHHRTLSATRPQPQA
jgi:hypothetical protein